jgi:peptidyl-prolyl cis-trans isomerase B (cyclophilin B)
MEDIDESAADITNTFLSWGGIPNYAQQMTIFAQAYGEESFDVIDTITNVETKVEAVDTAYTAPKEDILITSIEITTWGETGMDDWVPENYAK